MFVTVTLGRGNLCIEVRIEGFVRLDKLRKIYFCPDNS